MYSVYVPSVVFKVKMGMVDVTDRNPTEVTG